MVYRAGVTGTTREEKVSRQKLKMGVDTGLYYYGARYYDPQVSVWLSVDPLASDAPYLTPYRFSFNNPLNVVDPDGMFEDWVKNKKTGQAQWRSNVTSNATTPKGFKYLGPRYKGLTVGTYQTRSGHNGSANYTGLKIVLGYTDPNGKSRNLRWMQTVRADDNGTSNRTPNAPFNDPYTPDDNKPFYYTDLQVQGQTNQRGEDILFGDTPTRAHMGGISWKGELSLMENNGGNWSIMHTLEYGFEVDNNLNTILYDIQFKQPSSYQTNTLSNWLNRTPPVKVNASLKGLDTNF